MGFWDKLGSSAAPPARPAQRPAVGLGGLLPQGMEGNRQAAAERYMAHQQQVQQQQPQQFDPEDFDSINYVPPDPQDPHGYLTRRLHWRWRGNPKGGAGETIGNCPNCGSPRYFSRSNGTGVMNTNTGIIAHPSPRCEDCGHPNEQGMIGIGGAKVVGVGTARSAAAPPPPGSLQALQN